MEQSLPVIAKRIRGMVRVIFFMLRKSISKRKLMVDLNMMLERGNKLATKAIDHLMFHPHHHHQHYNHDDLHRHMPFAVPPGEYEFSCSNTPSYSLFHHLSKRGNNHHSNFFTCAFHAPPTDDDDVSTTSAPNSNAVAVEASPILPGFGRSPRVRQLRITDSPFPMRDVDDDNGVVDKKAEEFIAKFYKQLRQQRNMSD